ncbi:MAG: hypothetical protein ACTSRP_27030, partial [Candidatus Helarchaeota archaeon]
ITKNRTTKNEARSILQLLLENASGYLIHKYTGYKNIGEVERLGLASDILKIVPFIARAMQNGPTGKKPNCPLIWFLLIITGLILVVAAVLATIYLFVKLWEFLAKWGLKLLASFAKAAKQALENAIKIIILVLVCIIIALTLFSMVIAWIILPILLLMYSKLFNYWFKWEFFDIEIYDSSTNKLLLGFKYEIYWNYCNIFNMELPNQRILAYRENNITILKMDFSFLLPIWNIKFNFEYILNQFKEINNDLNYESNTLSIIPYRSPESLNLTTAGTHAPEFYPRVYTTPKPPKDFEGHPITITWYFRDLDLLNNTNEDHRHRLKYDKFPFDGNYQYISENMSDNWLECPKWVQNPENNLFYESSFTLTILNNLTPGKYNFVFEIAEIDASGNPVSQYHLNSSNITVIIYPGEDVFMNGYNIGFFQIFMVLILYSVIGLYKPELSATAVFFIIPLSTIFLLIAELEGYYKDENLPKLYVFALGYSYAIFSLGFSILEIFLSPIFKLDLILTALSIPAFYLLEFYILKPYDSLPLPMFIIHVMQVLVYSFTILIDNMVFNHSEKKDKPTLSVGYSMGVILTFFGFVLTILSSMYLNFILKN